MHDDQSLKQEEGGSGKEEILEKGDRQDARNLQKMPSETDVAPKAICGMGRDWVGNLWAGLC